MGVLVCYDVNGCVSVCAVCATVAPAMIYIVKGLIIAILIVLKNFFTNKEVF